MKEVYILTKSRNTDYTLTLDNYKESLFKIVQELNKYKEPYINLYITFEHIEYSQRNPLFKAICEYLAKHSINRINLHLVVAEEFVSHQEDIILFVHYMIEKYKKIDQLDIILNLIFDGKDIKDNQIHFAKLINYIHNRFLKIWVHVHENNISDLSEIMYKLTFNNLLNTSLITFDINLNAKISCELKQAIKSIPRDALMYLIDSYLDETSDWLSRFDKQCFDADGSILTYCPRSNDCILIRKNDSKLKMVPILKEIVYSLQGVSIDAEGGFGTHCNQCTNPKCPCKQN